MTDPSSAAVRGRLSDVLCTERSGSTVMSAMLGGSPQELAPPEMQQYRFANVEDWQSGYGKAQASLIWLLQRLGEPATASDLARRFAGQSPGAIYGALLEHIGPGRFLVDKTPAYARSLEVLRSLEELTPFYVWLVRHPLGVAASILELQRASREERIRREPSSMRRLKLRMKTFAARFGRGRSDVQTAVERWCESHLRIAEHLAAIPEQRQVRVRYEQLVWTPEAELEPLLARTGIAPDPAMLRPWDSAPTALAWDLGDPTVGRRRTIDTNPADRWRDCFDERVIDARTRALMARLGLMAGKTDTRPGGDAPRGRSCQ
jgi:hypothetical protein